jgi:hypothetical protein
MATPVAPPYTDVAPANPNSSKETVTEPCIFHQTLDVIKKFVTKDLPENLDVVLDIAVLAALCTNVFLICKPRP